MFQKRPQLPCAGAVFFINLEEVSSLQEYLTVGKAGIGEYEEKRSRFIGSIIPVTTEQEAIEHINKVKKENFGARHNVYAYILRDNGLTRYSDDGEPHSTAGMPTLDVLRKTGLTDVCVVVTRYFGGVLLGTGGLVRAYTAAAKAAVDAAGIVKMQYCNICKAECDYSDAEQLTRVIGMNGGNLRDTVYTDKVEIIFAVTEQEFSPLCDKVTEQFCGRITVEKTDSDYSAVEL